MNSQQNPFFFETQQIPENSLLFEELQKQELFFSYFMVDQKYYLFFYGEKYIDIDTIDPFIDILQELNTKERKIRSLRGFFIYASEIMENGKDVEVLNTNLKSSFWRTLKTILRQNKKTVLIKFLFPTSNLEVLNNPEDQIKNIKNFKSLLKSLQDQIHSLQERVTHLENQIIIKEKDTGVLSDASKVDDKMPSKVEQGDPSFKQYSDASDLSNTSSEEYQKAVESGILLDGSKTPLKAFPNTEQNLSSTQDKDQNEPNFITLGKISEAEKIEIIKRGFQLQNQGKLSFKKYYEGTEEYSLFQSKGYRIKYETIRKTKIYQQLKP